MSLLDDKFEEFIDTYDDENVGGLDCEEIEGVRPETSDVMKHILNDFDSQRRLERQKVDLTTVVRVDDDDGNDAREVIVVEDNEKEDRFDCESIISTYSNLYNHPKLISEPRKISVSGLPQLKCREESVFLFLGQSICQLCNVEAFSFAKKLQKQPAP